VDFDECFVLQVIKSTYASDAKTANEYLVYSFSIIQSRNIQQYVRIRPTPGNALFTNSKVSSSAPIV
jgi:hypothetical protein